MHEFFAPCPRGLESVLFQELTDLGAAAPVESRAGVAFQGPLTIGYRACLWSRVASRVLLTLSRFQAADADALHARVEQICWEDHVAPDGTIAVQAVCGPGTIIDHSGYAALKVKDAIVDRLRSRYGVRPSVDTHQPDLRVHLHLHGELATISVDLSGEPLHRRCYRVDGGSAPLKENLAAGLLGLAGWPLLAAQGHPFLDPMCGSGTLVIEAAQMAADLAPGLHRPFGLLRWRGHDPAAWELLQREAAERAEQGHTQVRSAIIGFDADATAVGRARENARRAGVGELVRLEQRDIVRLSSTDPPVQPGLLLVNPPYGKRIGEEAALIPLYIALGDLLKRRFTGWSAHLLSGDRELTAHLGLRARKRYVVFNGPIECRLLHYPILGQPSSPGRSMSGAEDFKNRLRKNQSRLGRWAQRAGVTCYRVYDADIPEYAVAVDRYHDWIHVQEYAPPAKVDRRTARRRLRQVLATIPEVMNISPQDVFLKVRRRQRGEAQYDKLSSSGDMRQVSEGPYRFLVNLRDHLDTMLFIEQRLSRTRIGELSEGQRFLNLFCYTGAATVYAAGGGARETVSVDLSSTYIDWARRNLELNALWSRRHRLVCADCVEWIKQERARYGLIYLNPPTFSRSKVMNGTLDILRDHAWLLRAASRLLAPSGLLLFATGALRFELDAAALPELEVEEISHRMLPPDFARTPWVHRVFSIRRRVG